MIAYLRCSLRSAGVMLSSQVLYNVFTHSSTSLIVGVFIIILCFKFMSVLLICLISLRHTPFVLQITGKKDINLKCRTEHDSSISV